MHDMLLSLVMKAAGSALTGLVHNSLSESKCRLNVQGVGIHKYSYTSKRITSMLGLLPFTHYRITCLYRMSSLSVYAQCMIVL
ncbi:hypothetical protein ACE6H2_009192 [Prunus campanulata]